MAQVNESGAWVIKTPPGAPNIPISLGINKLHLIRRVLYLKRAKEDK